MISSEIDTLSTSSAIHSSQAPNTYVTIHHVTAHLVAQNHGLLEYLHAVFAQVVDEGMTYPQEGDMTEDAFKAYFFGGDVFVAIIDQDGSGKTHGQEIAEGKVIETTIHAVVNGRSWDESVAGFYYVKPNYPGRSSHNCNAGFVVPPHQRGRNFGTILAKSYLYYGPRLGYEASVFNLVYVNNTASIRLWDRLGFTKAGVIPRAGRLKRPDDQGEHFVDAYVYYKRFADK
ncbi:hypothetical protein HGRIS_001975 [Hohenbuehelia grisea]|uniref:N-acetyltransferase domain-containing protein n=1 Tax=Hohenbuehelia grisea TaxID=104357 RepID=A0ABR3JJ19_9AGAR